MLDRGTATSAVDMELPQIELPVMAGWPYRYWIQYPAGKQRQAAITRFSARALAYNLILTAIPIVLVGLYLLRRQRSVGTNRKAISIADLLVLTLILAAPLGWWKQLEKRADQHRLQMNKLRSSSGWLSSSAWVPSLLKEHLPDRFVSNLVRLRGLRLEHPSGGDVEVAAGVRTLTSLRIGGGDYDLRLLDDLAIHPHLTDLRIAGRTVDAGLLESISKIENLQSLNLGRTNVSAGALDLLASCKSLRQLNLIHSDVDLPKLGNIKLRDTLHRLTVGHAAAGETTNLNLTDWPKLEFLSIQELDSFRNATAMKVVLRNLPKLQELQLCQFQKFDLDLSGLPKLAQITQANHKWQSRLPHSGGIPETLWCNQFSLVDAPQLKELSIYAPDLEVMKVQDSVGLQNLTLRATQATRTGRDEVSKLKRKVADRWLKNVGLHGELKSLDLFMVSLAGTDLSPLSKNESLKKLVLSYTGTEPEQWRSLAPLQELRELDLLGNSVDAESLDWILDTFPNLEDLAFSVGDDPSRFVARGSLSLEVIDRPKLKNLKTDEGAFRYFSEVQVVRSPEFETSLQLGFLRKLSIVDSGSVTGLAVHGPFPADTKLRGLRDLKFFAAGGPNVTDDVVKAVSECSDLNVLTLAYPATTRTGLAELNQVSQLTSLSLPGAPLDDELVDQWPRMPTLRHLDLRDTRVTGKSIKKLAADSSFERLVLDRAPVLAADLGCLARQPELTVLSLVGVGIDGPTLTELMKFDRLSVLDLSGTTVSNKTLQAIADHGTSLQLLVLTDCTFDTKALTKLAAERNQLSFDLSTEALPVELMSKLLSANRVVDRQQWTMNQAFQRMFANQQQGIQMLQPDLPGIISIDLFAEMSQRMDASAIAGEATNPNEDTSEAE